MPEWDPNLETGIGKIDGYHRKFFTSFDQLHQAVQARQSKYILREFLEFLELHIEEHFYDEESLMLSEGYPGFLAHKLNHDEFKQRLHALIVRYKFTGHSSSIVIETCSFATTWLVEHVLKMDGAMAKFLAEKKRAKTSA